MLSNILANIGQTLRQKTTLTEIEQGKVIEFFQHYRTGLWLYPGAFKRKTRFTMGKTYDILSLLEEEKFLDGYYELYCSQCQKSSGVVVKAFNEIPKTFVCEVCLNELPGVENAVLIYKVIQG